MLDSKSLTWYEGAVIAIHDGDIAWVEAVVDGNIHAGQAVPSAGNAPCP